jgi:hypothetical protein
MGAFGTEGQVHSRTLRRHNSGFELAHELRTAPGLWVQKPTLPSRTRDQRRVRGAAQRSTYPSTKLRGPESVQTTWDGLNRLDLRPRSDISPYRTRRSPVRARLAPFTKRSAHREIGHGRRSRRPTSSLVAIFIAGESSFCVWSGTLPGATAIQIPSATRVTRSARVARSPRQDFLGEDHSGHQHHPEQLITPSANRTTINSQHSRHSRHRAPSPCGSRRASLHASRQDSVREMRR